MFLFVPWFSAGDVRGLGGGAPCFAGGFLVIDYVRVWGEP